MAGKDVSLFERPLLSFARSTRQRMGIVACGAGLAVLQSAAADRGASLVLAVCCVAGSLAAEGVVSFLKKQRLINDLSALASGLVFALLLPAGIHPAFAFAGAFFAAGVVKGASGGLGSNWLNPALAAWLFVRYSWPGPYAAAFDAGRLTARGSVIEYAPGASLAAAWAGGAADRLNRTFFHLFSAEIPSGFAAFLFNTEAALVADRGVAALLAASILVSASVHRFLLSAVYLACYLFLVRLGGGTDGGWWTGDMFYCLFSGGTLAAAFFLIADPATGAKSLTGKIICAGLAAGLSFLFRYGRDEPCGAFFAVAALNMICPVIRGVESRRIYRNAGLAAGTREGRL